MSLHGRERRKVATRRALRAATLDLGLELGFGQVRVEEITARAGVSKRTFFNYFATKEDAALLDVLTVSDEGLSTLTGPVGTLWPQLATLFGADVERVDGFDLPRLTELQRSHPPLESRQLAVFGRFAARLATAIAALSADDEAALLRAGVMAGSCITAVRIGLESWARAGWAGSPRPHVEAGFAVLAPAFETSG